MEEFNQKFLTDLQCQIDDMFTNAANRKVQKAPLEGEGDAQEDKKANDDAEEAVQKDDE